MPGPEFWQTQDGRQFYDGTMPRIAKALQDIAQQLAIDGKLQDNKEEPAWRRICKITTAMFDLKTANLSPELKDRLMAKLDKALADIADEK